ncbi:MAG: hypothetical protein R2754_05575 [Microthrixaceae bacterium]
MGVIGGIGPLGGAGGAALSGFLVVVSLAALARVRRRWMEEAEAADTSLPLRAAHRQQRRPPPDWFVDLGSSWGSGHPDEGSELTLAHSGRPVGRPPR